MSPISRRKLVLSLIYGLFVALLPHPLAAQSELSSKMDFVRATASTLEARWDRLSTPRKMLSYTKRAIPLYSWIILCNAVKTADASFLMGECLSEESNAVRLPMEQFLPEYRAIISRLWALNELDAISFSDAMIGQSTTDRAGTVDAGDAPQGWIKDNSSEENRTKPFPP